MMREFVESFLQNYCIQQLIQYFVLKTVLILSQRNIMFSADLVLQKF